MTIQGRDEKKIDLTEQGQTSDYIIYYTLLPASTTLQPTSTEAKPFNPEFPVPCSIFRCLLAENLRGLPLCLTLEARLFLL